MARTVCLVLLLVSAVFLAFYQGLAQESSTDKPSSFDFANRQPHPLADQVELFSGQVGVTFPLLTLSGPGRLRLPITLTYSSNVVGLDPLSKENIEDGGSYQPNQAAWVGLGWSLNTGHIALSHGYASALGQDFVLVLPEGGYPLVQQGPTNRFLLQRDRYWTVEWVRQEESSYWVAWDLAGRKYTFGRVVRDGQRFGTVLRAESVVHSTDFTKGKGEFAIDSNTLRVPAVDPGFSSVVRYEHPFIYRWNLAEIEDPSGNRMTFTYSRDRDWPLTTFRSVREKRRNLYGAWVYMIEAQDLVPAEGMGRFPEILKTAEMAHLEKIEVFNSEGKLVRRLHFETVEQSYLRPLLASTPLQIPVTASKLLELYHDSVSGPNRGLSGAYFKDLLQTIRRNEAYYQNLDGLGTRMRLETIVLEDHLGRMTQQILFGYRHPPDNLAGVLPGTPLLNRVEFRGGDGVTLPPYRFAYEAWSDSIRAPRLTRIVYPGGGFVEYTYEPYLRPEEKGYSMMRRVKRRQITTGQPDAPSQETLYRYSPFIRYDLEGDGLLDFVGYRWVEEQFTNAGRTRHEFINDEDYPRESPSDPTSMVHALRGLEKAVYHYGEKPVPLEQSINQWQAVKQGQPSIWPSTRQKQSWHVQLARVEKTRDGIEQVRRFQYSAVNGLVRCEQLATPLFKRITETTYHPPLSGDPVALDWENPPQILDGNLAPPFSAYSGAGAINRVWVQSQPGTKPPTLRVRFAAQFPVEERMLYHLVGCGGYQDVAVPATAGGEVVVRVVWNDTTRQELWRSNYQSVAGRAMSERFDLTFLPPAGVGFARLELELEAISLAEGDGQSRLETFGKVLQFTGLPTQEDRAYSLMFNRHILDQPQAITIRAEPDGSILSYQKFTYGLFDDRPFLKTVHEWLDGSENPGRVDAHELVPVTHYTHYDRTGNPVEVEDAWHTPTTTLWGYRGSQPVAVVQGAGYKEILYDGFEGQTVVPASRSLGHWHYTGTCRIVANSTYTGGESVRMDPGSRLTTRVTVVPGKTYTYSAWIKGVGARLVCRDGQGNEISTLPSEGEAWKRYTLRVTPTAGQTQLSLEIHADASLYVDDVRFCPQGALLTSWTYDALGNKTAISDAAGNSRIYRYDGLGRLVEETNSAREVIRTLQYNYYAKPQVTAP